MRKTICPGLALGASVLIVSLVLHAAEKLAPPAEKDRFKTSSPNSELSSMFSLPSERNGFKVGPGVEVATSQCLLCHSADYVSTQPRLPRTAWKAIVQKMKDKYGAPLPDDKIEVLVTYLAKSYGAEAR